MTKLIEVVIGSISGLLLFSVLAWCAKDFNSNDFGLGKNTHSFTADFESNRISGYGKDIPYFRALTKKLRSQGKKVFLWVGASQLHAINQPNPNDHLAITFANQASHDRDSNIRYIQISEPNANLHELWSFVQHFVSKDLVDGVILGFTYDDLREVEVRSQLLEYYAESPVDPEVITKAKLSQKKGGVVPTKHTPQHILETFLVIWIEKLFPDFEQRDQIRAFINANYRLGVVRVIFALFEKPQVSISSSRLEWNEKAFDAILELSAKSNLPMMIYQAPHRPGLKKFTHPRQEYDLFHNKLQAKLKSYPNVNFINLEKLVPAEHWGISASSQPDVFHFQEEGHRALGQAVESAVDQWQPFRK